MNSVNPHGAINQSSLNRKDDFLYRLSLKGLIRDEQGNVLVVKEAGRTWWDLPGGGMDHGEDIKAALARELHEEVGLEGDFTYRIIDVDDPIYLENANVLQVRLIFEVTPDVLPSKVGHDGDELAYMHPEVLRNSSHPIEQRVYHYYQKI